MQMTDPEILRYVLEHMEQYPDPTIRKALVDKGIELERVEKAMEEAKRLAKQAKATGQPIDLGAPPQPGLPGWVWVGLSLLAVGAAALAWLALRRPA
jgi:hypothetical protein